MKDNSRVMVVVGSEWATARARSIDRRCGILPDSLADCAAATKIQFFSGSGDFVASAGAAWLTNGLLLPDYTSPAGHQPDRTTTAVGQDKRAPAPWPLSDIWRRQQGIFIVKHALRFCLLTLTASFSILAAPLPIKSAITAIEKQKVDAFMNGRSALAISNYQSPHLDSIAPVEHVLFRRAILLGGLDAVFEDFVVPNSARARASVFNGNALSAGGAHWHVYYKELQDHVLESDVVIAHGVYEKGLYVNKERQHRFRIQSGDDLAKLSAVSDKNWDVDWTTLSRLKLSKLHSAPTRGSQFKMIEAGRADFTLQDFSSSPELSIEEQGVRLFPIPGVKIALEGTRHFFINKDSPHGRAVFEALQKGLKILKQRGEIDRALLETGITNKAVAGWLQLN